MHYNENTVYYEDTLMTYVREWKNTSFEEARFNEVDALLLCQMMNLQMEWLVPKLKSGVHDSYAWRSPNRIQTIGWADMERNEDLLYGDSVYGTMYADLFHEIKDSRRFGEIRLGCMRALKDQKKMVQFAALTAWLDDENAVVLFRGTDSSLVGWREDFKYAYIRTWPAHTLAREYLMDVARLIPEKLYVAGHSKGGNLAVYASALVPAYVQKRIRKVYSYDGMGFRSSFYKTEGYQRITDKVYKLVPAESLIGMLFVPEKGFKIVESYEHGFLQHDLMNWKVRDGKFVLREKFSKKQNRLINRLNRWVLSLTGKERKGFVDLLFQTLGDLLEKDGAQAMTENDSLFKIVREKMSGMTKEERKLFIRSVRRFIMPKKPPHTKHIHKKDQQAQETVQSHDM